MSTSRREIDILVDLLSRLPGLGPRSARRAVLHLIKRRRELMTPLAASLNRVAENVSECEICMNYCDGKLCEICLSEERDQKTICVVQDVSDLWAIERANVYRGTYHVLGGLLSYIESIGPEELRIPELIDRIRSCDASEVILALSSTVEGQTTAHVIVDEVEPTRVPVTSLGQGVPIGGELEYLDDGTILAALRTRTRY